MNFQQHRQPEPRFKHLKLSSIFIFGMANRLFNFNSICSCKEKIILSHNTKVMGLNILYQNKIDSNYYIHKVTSALLFIYIIHLFTSTLSHIVYIAFSLKIFVLYKDVLLYQRAREPVKRTFGFPGCFNFKCQRE